MPYKITENDVNYCTALCYKFHARYGRIPDEDQIQDCLEFMCIAAKKYTPELSPKFMTYARWWILRAVQKEYVRIHGNGYVINNFHGELTLITHCIISSCSKIVGFAIIKI